MPVLPRGARTSIAGQAVNTAVVLDFTRHLDRILEIDPEARTARVQPGVVLDDLRDAARPHGLTFGPDPSTHNRCTLGGMIGNNACGSHSVAWGKTVDNVRALDVLTYRGERLRLGRGEPAAGRIPEALRALGERCAARRPRRRSPTSPAGSPATTSTSCCRSTGSTWPGRWSAPRAPARRSSGRPSGWSSRRRRGRWPCSASRTPTSRPTT